MPSHTHRTKTSISWPPLHYVCTLMNFLNYPFREIIPSLVLESRRQHITVDYEDNLQLLFAQNQSSAERQIALQNNRLSGSNKLRNINEHPNTGRQFVQMLSGERYVIFVCLNAQWKTFRTPGRPSNSTYCSTKEPFSCLKIG